MSYCRWYLSSVTAYLVSSPGSIKSPDFVMYHPTPVGWIVALFLLTAAQILLCISKLPGVERLFGLFLLPVPKTCYISSNADSSCFSTLSSQKLFVVLFLLLCISKLPGMEQLALFLLTVAKIL
jgi:hypothetical protein